MRAEPSRDAAASRRPTVRTTRRGLLAKVGATAALAGLAGCSGPEVQETTRSLREGAGGFSGSEYEEYVAEMRDRYGESGVDHDRYDHLEFERAWTASFGVGGTDPTVATDHALALYRVVGKVDSADREYFRLWQWSGARVREIGGIGSPAVSRLANRVRLPQGRVDLLSYAPDGSRSGVGTATVGLADPSAAGPSGSVPLHGGSLGPAESRVGSGGQFGVRWSGRTAPVQSVAGACSLRRPPDVDVLVDWTLEVRAGTRLQ